jgi:hypothetical protein
VTHNTVRRTEQTDSMWVGVHYVLCSCDLLSVQLVGVPFASVVAPIITALGCVF